MRLVKFFATTESAKKKLANPSALIKKIKDCNCKTGKKGKAKVEETCEIPQEKKEGIPS